MVCRHSEARRDARDTLVFVPLFQMHDAGNSILGPGFSLSFKALWYVRKLDIYAEDASAKQFGVKLT